MNSESSEDAARVIWFCVMYVGVVLGYTKVIIKRLQVPHLLILNMLV